jgi:hypothetical protein
MKQNKTSNNNNNTPASTNAVCVANVGNNGA